MENSSTTSAFRLHAIFSQMRRSGANTTREGWETVLGVKWGTPEFVARHAEVVGLFNQTCHDASCLPEETKDRVRRYLSYWWSALIVPDRKWSDAHNANAFMSQGILDHLGAAADIIAVHLGGSASAPSGEGIAELKDQCEKLLELVQGIDGEHLPSHARREIIGQIQHLLWLIANVALFGEAPVSREASIVIGSLVQTSSQVARNNASVAGRWKKVVMAFVAAAAVFSAGTTAAQEAIDSGLGLAGEIASVVGGELDVSSD